MYQYPLPCEAEAYAQKELGTAQWFCANPRFLGARYSSHCYAKLLGHQRQKDVGGLSKDSCGGAIFHGTTWVLWCEGITVVKFEIRRTLFFDVSCKLNLKHPVSEVPDSPELKWTWWNKLPCNDSMIIKHHFWMLQPTVPRLNLRPHVSQPRLWPTCI
jgi:hypothetical protein